MNTNTQLIVPRACRFFGLGEILKVDPAGGYANSNYTVDTSKGKFFLKVSLEHTASEIEKEITYLERVASNSLPVPVYIPGAGRKSVFECGDFTVTAVNHVTGECLDQLNRTQLEKVAQAAAILHKIDCEGLPSRKTWWSEGQLEQSLRKTQPHFEAEHDRLAMRVESLTEFLDTDLPKSIVHGDLSRYNLMFSGDELVALLDWEEVNVSSSILDLAYMAVSHCFPDGRFSDPTFRALIHAYDGTRRLEPSERYYLNPAAHFVVCTILAWVLARSSDKGSKLGLMPIYERFSNLELGDIRFD